MDHSHPTDTALVPQIKRHLSVNLPYYLRLTCLRNQVNAVQRAAPNNALCPARFTHISSVHDHRCLPGAQNNPRKAATGLRKGGHPRRQKTQFALRARTQGSLQLVASPGSLQQGSTAPRKGGAAALSRVSVRNPLCPTACACCDAFPQTQIDSTSSSTLLHALFRGSMLQQTSRCGVKTLVAVERRHR